MLVWYASWKEHVALYPVSSRIEAFKTELSAYDGTKVSVKFPISKSIPFDLISRLVKFRVQENLKNSK